MVKLTLAELTSVFSIIQHYGQLQLLMGDILI